MLVLSRIWADKEKQIFTSTKSAKYVGCSKSNASYFTMLAANVRGGYWCSNRRSWNFPPICHCMLLLWNRCQQRSSLTQWHLTWKWVWSKGLELDSSVWKKMTPINICCRLPNVNGNQRVWVWAHWGGGWCLLTVTVITSADANFPNMAYRLLFITGEKA